jgi:hypothetical protein
MIIRRMFMVKKYSSILLIIFCLLFVLAACSSNQTTNATQPAMSSGLNGTIPAGQTSTQQLTTVAATEVSTAVATETRTPEPTATATAVTIESTAIITIYCQNGPSENYASVYIMKKGSQMTTLGRNDANDYYLVQFEDGTNNQCWAWKNYISIAGNSYDLPVVTVKATTK